jgi:hypothetical protein
MMTTTSDHDARQKDGTAGSPLKRALIGIVAAVVATFTLGVGVGIAARGLEDGFRPLTVALLLAAMLVTGALAYVILRQFRAGATQPMGERPRRASRLVWVSVLIGAGLGVLLAASSIQLDRPFALYSNDPLPALPVAIATAVWLLVVPVITWRWSRTVDEHEMRAYTFGAIVAMYLYVFVTPAWWLGWRGGFLPEPEHMLTFCAVMFAWLLGWFWRRYR